MSEIKDETIEAIKKVAEQEKTKSEAQDLKAQYDRKIYEAKLRELEQEERELDLAKKSTYGALSREEIEQTLKDNEAYMEAAKYPMVFIHEAFNKLIPFFQKNLILVAGQTGEGKSTTVANMAFTNLTKKSKKTGKLLRTLIITNEEKREDLYNRITCLYKGWHYTNHSTFTDEQRAEFNRMIPILSSDARLTIIDDGHGGSQGVTTSIEGLEAIFASLIANNEWYDVIIIDYYQNVIHSKLNPGLDQYKVQERVSRLLNSIKNIYPAPITIMAQLKPHNPDQKDRPPFQQRLMGSKSIMVPCTFAVEMVIDRKNLRTKWVVHKSRYTEAFGVRDFWTGYENGRFVEYTTAFAEKVQTRAYDRTNGIKDVFKKKDDKKEEK